MEEKFYLTSGANRLEGLYVPGSAGRGVIVTHPHPLYGGDMHNPVVLAACRAYRQKGFATLRFNFRGVGRSTGRYGEGTGEQADVTAAVSWMVAAGAGRLDLTGYSFGAWVNALTGGDFDAVVRMVMLSPPVSFIDFSAVGELPRLGLVVTGEHDDIAPAEEVRAALKRWNPAARFETVAGTDHFYSGALQRLESLLAACL